MDRTINAIQIHEKDNVVTVTRRITRGSMLEYGIEGNVRRIKVLDDIPQFHKVAVADIKKDEHVYKYGQLIGRAVTNIMSGGYVHDHNIVSPAN